MYKHAMLREDLLSFMPYFLVFCCLIRDTNTIGFQCLKGSICRHVVPVCSLEGQAFPLSQEEQLACRHSDWCTLMFPQCSSHKVSLTWCILKNTELIKFPNGFFGDVGNWETHQGLLRVHTSSKQERKIQLSTVDV